MTMILSLCNIFFVFSIAISNRKLLGLVQMALGEGGFLYVCAFGMWI